MKYLKFTISNYRAIEGPLIIDLKRTSLIPLVGINECGKTTILQAIYCFDYINDSEYDSKHINNTLNLYKTVDIDPIVSADISLKYSELFEGLETAKYNLIAEIEEEKDEIVKKVENETEVEEDDMNENNEEEGEEIDNEVRISRLDDQISKINEFKAPFEKKGFNNQIRIERNLRNKKYRIVGTSSEDETTSNLLEELSRIIVKRLPYILYNDDFIDRPPNEIKILSKKPYNLTGWLAIYERLFNETDQQYSLFNIVKEKDKRRRDAILSDVQENLNKTLSKAWKTFILKKEVKALNIRLNLEILSDDKYSGKLQINIIERMGSKERFFEIIDRSKGFLWYFNFVMKLEFNPKVIGNKKDTVYLLDEPGSYLHSSAQEKLCQKIKEISEKHGNVIYCTHSHNLLNPDRIPLNNIYIVQKDNQKKISASPLPTTKGKSELNSAYQPIHEALETSVFQSINNDSKIIAVEGIYDKYAISLFTKINEDEISIIPGTSASSIKKNIQFLNGYEKDYIAIWDNDKEGRKEFNDAKKIFGEIESERFDLLPALENGNRKMEDMFLEKDLMMLGKELLGEGNAADYENIISSLYHAKRTIKKSLIEKCSKETKENFTILDKVIKKRFQQSKELYENKI